MSGNDDDSNQVATDGPDYGFYKMDPRVAPPSMSGPMWNQLQGNMEERRAQAFQRVEGSAHVYLPALLAPGWTLQDLNGDIPLATAIQYSAAGTKGSNDEAAYTFSQLCRGEAAGPKNEPIRWETLGGLEQPRYCTHTLFPTKFTRAFGAKVDTFFMSYYCFYSSNPIQPPTGSWEPRYKSFSLSPDATVDGETPTGAKINIDMALINDDSCIVSVIASCQNAYALSGSYITFVPRIDEQLYRTSTHWSHPSRYTIGGASLGMAVFAAIKGWLPVLYSGYLNAPMPGGKFVSNPDVREAMSMAKYGEGLFAPATYDVDGNKGQYSMQYTDKPWYLNPAAQQQGNDAAVAVKEFPIFTRVMAQTNFVESVGNIFSKIIYATVHGIPIFIPMQSSFRTDLATYVSRFRENPKAIQWMGMVPTYYTAAMMEDGYPMLARVESRLDMIPNIIMPLTMTDASALQLRLYNVIAKKDKLKARIGSAGGAERARQVAMFTNARQNMINIASNEYNRSKAARQPERSALKAEKEKADRENWARGKRNQALDLIRSQFSGQRKTAKDTREAEKKAKSAQVKTAVDAKRTELKGAKEKISLEKATIKQNYRALNNPTEQDRADYRQKLAAVDKNPLNAKQRFAAIKLRPKMVTQRLQRQADGKYSDDAKAELKRRRTKDNDIINQFANENPDQFTAKQRGEQRKQANESRAAQNAKTAADTAAAMRVLQLENDRLRQGTRAPGQSNDFGEPAARTVGGPGMRNQQDNTNVSGGNQNPVPLQQGETSQANPAGRFGGRRIVDRQYLGASAGIGSAIGGIVDDIFDL